MKPVDKLRSLIGEDDVDREEERRKFRIIHHTDADGFCAAAIVYYWLMRNDKAGDAVFVPMNYGLKLPDEDFDYQKDVFFMVDFSLQPDEAMKKFCSKARHFTWIDHHDTCLKTEKDLGLEKIPGIRKSGLAGCELTWGFLFPKREMPEFVRIIGTWDTWRREDMKFWNETVVPYMAMMNSSDKSPEEHIEWWTNRIMATAEQNEKYLKADLEIGRIINAYDLYRNDRDMKEKAYEAKFAGHPALLINRDGNSIMFERMDPSKKLLWVTYQHVKGKFWTVGLYSMNDKIYCGELAKKLGNAGPMKSGGGHKGAAGFQTTWKYLESLIEMPK